VELQEIMMKKVRVNENRRLEKMQKREEKKGIKSKRKRRYRQKR
jgi:hypothetical protein